MIRGLLRFIALTILLCLSACARYEPDPLQAKFLKDVGYYPEETYRIVSAEVLRSKLSRYGELMVVEGQYKLPKVWDMPHGEWCSPFPGSDTLPGDCQVTSDWAEQKMEGYAFGIAWNENHMLNIAVLDVNSEIRLAHYEPQTCNFTILADVKGVIID